MKKKTAVIIGAGPAGLTAAYELLQHSDIKPVIFEMSGDTGGISKTVEYRGNRIDIGGHRFFSKSEKVMAWWDTILPQQGALSKDDKALGRQISCSDKIGAPDPEKTDRVMLIRSRLSRIFYLRSFFDYPVSLNFNTVKNLGLIRIVKIGFSYILVRIFPVRNEKTLEDFFINRFGRELYKTFFKDYTEKVWGISCTEISNEWGAQRIKGLSLMKTLFHAVKRIFLKDSSVSQKNIETSLIEQFLYPKFGPGHLWSEVARQIVMMGGEIHYHSEVNSIENSDKVIKSVTVVNKKSGKSSKISGNYVISTMPIRDLIGAFKKDVPVNVAKIAAGLQYRDFITVGLLLKKLKIKNETANKTVNNIVPDNWIYIQERDVKIGRLQIFNNWSPYLVKNQDNVWIGLEYFCNEGDDLWTMTDKGFLSFAVEELVKIDIIEKNDVLDGTVLRVQKTYPAYFGTYDKFDTVKKYVNRFENLFLIGRNGMHRYNNMDHSMLTAMEAVQNIISGKKTKENIWDVNAEEEYHEEKK
jgi:protoporphyrinogen oxidase